MVEWCEHMIGEDHRSAVSEGASGLGFAGGGEVCVTGLDAEEFGVSAVDLEKVIVGTDFADLALFEDDDAMCVSDGAEAVGDDEAGSRGHEG